MQYFIRLSDLLRAFQDQENIIVPVMFSWGEKLFCLYSYTHEDIREFESNNSLEARIGKQMCMVTRSIQAWKDKKCISEPANCPTYKSADSLVQVCNLVYDLLTPTLITQE